MEERADRPLRKAASKSVAQHFGILITVQYKIIQSNTSLLYCLVLRSGYMFRSQGPSSGLNTNTT
jgi:hypothetical protein